MTEQIIGHWNWERPLRLDLPHALFKPFLLPLGKVAWIQCGPREQLVPTFSTVTLTARPLMLESEEHG